MSTREHCEYVISIVTASLNQGEFIEETIRSVLSQEGEFYIDYIIRDGGSSDESVQIIQSYENLLRENCDVVEKFGLTLYVPTNSEFEWNQCLGISYRWVSERDHGQSDAINRGLRAAKGPIAAFINSDDMYCPGAFRKIVELDWGDADFVYGEGIWISQDSEDLLYYPTFKPTRYSLYYQCTLCQPTVFFRKDAFERLGDFSLKYSCAFDYEYWLRAIFQGCEFEYLAECLARSRMHATNKSLTSKSRNLQEVGELKRSYYSDKSGWMSKLRLWRNFFSIQIPTHRRVSRLKKLLAKPH